ncbi:magnesium transporter CorA family protein [Lacticaseibacillus hulanensis]|uniref:magnesium transporter CorA family protein n=1 Tax=Lacticaseibacillus hulanensis TaxID=2493111 RepID=UPI000FD7B699|nr:magnesium transporter CorA family protein [Lacticaseibacillus hulanensis]
MATKYKITKQGLQVSPNGDFDLLVLTNDDKAEVKQTIDDYRLPRNIFQAGDEAEEVTRYEELLGTKLTDAKVLVLMDISANIEAAIEERLEPLTMIRAKEHLIVHLNVGSSFVDNLIDEYNEQLTTQAHFLGCAIYRVSTHFMLELNRVKKVIDELDEAARKTTKNKELFRLADTERLMVYLDHSLQDQHLTLKRLWAESDLAAEIDDPRFVQDIQLRQHHIEKLVRIYRDLLETIGGLFTDMMDNNLNHLMKYLDSAGLVISVPALISGIWGMNVGGLPGKGSGIGFTLVMIAMVILAILTGIHLATRDFND